MNGAFIRLGLALALLPVPIRAESFEGYIASMPIWMDLRIPAGEGPVSGLSSGVGLSAASN